LYAAVSVELSVLLVLEPIEPVESLELIEPVEPLEPIEPSVSEPAAYAKPAFASNAMPTSFTIFMMSPVR